MATFRLVPTTDPAATIEVEAASASEALTAATDTKLVEVDLWRDGRYYLSMRRLRPDCAYWMVTHGGHPLAARG